MLVKTTFREIKNSLSRYLAIVAIMALGVGVFCGLRMCRDDMVDTANDYLKEHNMFDYEILSSYGVDEGSLKLAMNTPGVKQAETSMQKDIIISIKGEGGTSNVVFKAISIPKEINTLRVVSGRLPEKDNECVVDNYSTVGSKFEIGEKIILSASNNQNDLDAFKNKKFTVVGTVNTPLYLDYERGSTDLGDGYLDTFFFINRSAFDTDYDTQMYVKLEGSEESFAKASEKKLKKYESSMEKLSKLVTEDRRERIQDDFRELLDGKKAQYNAGLAKYNQEKAYASGAIRSGKNQIISGINTANQSEAQLRTTLAELQATRVQVVNGLQQVEDKRHSIEQQHSQGLIDDIVYASAMKIIDSTKSELQSNLTQIDDGIAQVNDAFEIINSKRKEISKGENELKTKSKTAKTELSKAKAELDRAKAALDDAEAQIDEMETGNHFALTREDNTGYSSFESNAEIVNNVSKVFPAFFLLVAALVCMTTMTRMVEEQRSQIGTLRALGYKSASIRRIYLFYAGSASLLGSVIGYFAGIRIFPSVIWKAYNIMYDFNYSINHLINWKLFLFATLAALACSMGATWVSCANEFRNVPAELIRHKAPPAGKKILMERFTWLWNKLGFMQKVSFRNVFRYKKRLLMMVIGIGGCTALLIAGFGIRTTISGVGERQYNEVTVYDYHIAFSANMDASKQKELLADIKNDVGDVGEFQFVHQSSATIEKGDFSKEVNIIATNDEKLSQFIKMKLDGEKVDLPGDGEVVLCRKMTEQYGLKVGDTIHIKDGYYKMDAKISGFYDNYVNETMIMSASTYEKGFGKKVDYKTAYVKSPKSATIKEIRQNATAIRQNANVAAVVTSESIIDRVTTMMMSLNFVVLVIILCAGLLAFIVLYNLTNINILERIREIATIKVLGFRKGETASYVFRENFILSVIGAVAGIPLGKWLLDFIIDSIKLDIIFYLPRLTALDYALAVVITFAFTIIVSFIMRPKINKVSMTESLKTVE